jgi:hypothetical protein
MNSQPRNRKIILFISGVALLFFLFGIFLYLRPAQPTSVAGHRPLPSIYWKTFDGTNPPFNFVFECPVSWKVKETKLAESFNMVQVLGPQDKTTKVIPAIYIKVKESKGEDVSSSFSQTILKKEGRFRGFKKLHEGSDVIGGVKGLRLGYQYVLPLPMRSMHAQDTVLRREEVLVENGGKSYQISFWTLGKNFEVDKIFFEYLLKSFKFKK